MLRNMSINSELNLDTLRSSLLKFTNGFDKFSALQIASGGAVTLIFVYACKIWYSRRYFKKKGIKTPPIRTFIGGNLPEIIENNYSETLQQWTKLYGKTYGYYEGHYPILVTSDIDLVQEIFVKQINNFSGRRYLPLQIDDKQPNLNVFLSSGRNWKRMRTIVNPTFAPARLKELVPLMRVCSDRLISKIKESNGKELNVTELLHRMAIDVVWNSAFGMDIDFVNKPENSLISKVISTLNSSQQYSIFFKFFYYFYETKPIVLPILEFITRVVSSINADYGQPFFALNQQIKSVFEERVKKGIQKRDYLQLLLDAQSNSKNDVDAEYIVKKLSDQEVVANSLQVLFAGFETTNFTLNACLFNMIKYPDELKKLKEEIDDNFEDEGSLEYIDYDSVNKLEYLDLFIKETLRVYPPAIGATTRRCTQKTTVNGIDFDKGLLIEIDGLSLHYNPEYWGPVDPHVFYPLRFAKESNINRVAYCPFGYGPRICVGMKFALLEIKITLVKIIKVFDLQSTVSTPEKLEFFDSLNRTLKTPIYIQMNKRVNA